MTEDREVCMWAAETEEGRCSRCAVESANSGRVEQYNPGW